jgi:hypothetical protein
MANVKTTLTTPRIKMRMKSFMTLYGATYDGTKNLSDTQLLSIPLKEIGACKKFKYKNDRSGLKYYRTFGKNKNGKIDEVYPGLGDYKLILETIVLYNDSLNEQFGYDSSDIMIQDSPMILQAVLSSPSGVQIRTLTFIGVWFQNNQIEFDAEAEDQQIAYEVNAEAAGCFPG